MQRLLTAFKLVKLFQPETWNASRPKTEYEQTIFSFNNSFFRFCECLICNVKVTSSCNVASAYSGSSVSSLK